MGYGESLRYVCGREDKKQGMCQGNTAAPPTWQQISSLMIEVQRQKGHGIAIRCPILDNVIPQIGLLYVDDTNLWEEIRESGDLDGALASSQLGMNNFGATLQAMGGQQNTDKCVFTIHDMQCNDKGKWE